MNIHAPVRKKSDRRRVVTPPNYLSLDEHSRATIAESSAIIQALTGPDAQQPWPGIEWFGDCAAWQPWANNLKHFLSPYVVARNGRHTPRAHTTRDEYRVYLAERDAALKHMASSDEEGTAKAVLLVASSLGLAHVALRDRDNFINPDRAGHVIALPCASVVPQGLGRLHSFLQLGAVPNAFKAQFALVSILNLHPLLDGNGRVARVLMNMILWSDSPRGTQYLPLYDIRSISDYAFEISLRKVELHNDWLELASFINRSLAALHEKVRATRTLRTPYEA